MTMREAFQPFQVSCIILPSEDLSNADFFACL